MQRILRNILPIIFIVLTVWPAFSQSESNFELAINVYNENGEYNKAINLFQLLKDNGNYSDRAVFLEAKTLYLKNNIKEATNLYLKLQQSDKIQANYELAQCYAQLNKPELATQYLALYLDEHTKKLPNEIKKDKAFEKIQKSDAWQKLWAKDWYSTYEMELMEAQFYLKNKNYSDALYLLDEITKKRERGDEAFHLKSLLFFETQEYSKALDEVKMAINIEDDVPAYFYLKAQIQLEIEKYKRALESINKAIALDSSKMEYYQTLIKVQSGLKNYNSAVLLTDRILNLSATPENLKLATTIYEQSGDYLSALKTINKCLKNQEYNADLYIQRANIYMATQTYKFAEKDYSMALDFYPYNGEIYYQRGIARQKMGRLDDACSDWFKARKYGFVNAEEKIKINCRKFLNTN